MSEKLENIRSISEAAQELILRQEEQGTDWADAVMVLLEKFQSCQNKINLPLRACLRVGIFRLCINKVQYV